jgi:hypothetical protein
VAVEVQEWSRRAGWAHEAVGRARPRSIPPSQAPGTIER